MQALFAPEGIHFAYGRMDELGGALGFEGKNMSVRISQYETGARIPGEDMILKLGVII